MSTDKHCVEQSASVVALNDAKLDEPCVEVSKMRSAGVFDRWCYKHHHWLSDAPPQRTVLDELIEGCRK